MGQAGNMETGMTGTGVLRVGHGMPGSRRALTAATAEKLLIEAGTGVTGGKVMQGVIAGSESGTTAGRTVQRAEAMSGSGAGRTAAETGGLTGTAVEVMNVTARGLTGQRGSTGTGTGSLTGTDADGACTNVDLPWLECHFISS